MASEYDDENAETPIGVTSLRDYFAGCAMAGLLQYDSLTYEAAAREAYRHADAMLAAREGKA